jgi:hypothetical protein
MAKAITIEAYYLSLTAPRGLSDAEYRAICRTLTRSRFQARLQDAIREFLGRYPSLAKVRVAVAR